MTYINKIICDVQDCEYTNWDHGMYAVFWEGGMKSAIPAKHICDTHYRMLFGPEAK